jgi:hypothetical protein
VTFYNLEALDDVIDEPSGRSCSESCCAMTRGNIKATQKDSGRLESGKTFTSSRARSSMRGDQQVLPRARCLSCLAQLVAETEKGANNYRFYASISSIKRPATLLKSERQQPKTHYVRSLNIPTVLRTFNKRAKRFPK